MGGTCQHPPLLPQRLVRRNAKHKNPDVHSNTNQCDEYYLQFHLSNNIRAKRKRRRIGNRNRTI